MKKCDIKRMKLSDLVPASYNPRKISEKALVGLSNSIERFGLVQPVVWNERTGNIVGGHQRFKVLREKGEKEIDVVVVDLDENDEVALNITLNNPVIQGEFADGVDDLLSGLKGSMGDAFDSLMLKDLDKSLHALAGEKKRLDAEPKTGCEEEMLKKWKVESGQIWKLGEHFLICGDCTSVSVWKKVMMGELANLLFTSPPYWVGMKYETQKSEKEIDDFICSCVKAWAGFVCKDYGRICINTGSAAIHRIEKRRSVEVLPLIDKWQFQLRTKGWLARHWRIWAKGGDLPASISAKVDVVDQHWEHIVSFDSEHSFLGTWWNPEGDQRGQEKIGTKWAQQGVWNDIRGDRSAKGHVAAFPLELPMRNISLYSKEGEIVIEPFCGSGTTIVACENLGRRCRATEISPSYVAISLERFQEATGKVPVLFGT